MDEKIIENIVSNQGQINSLNQGIYNSPITQYFNESSWKAQLQFVSGLRLESFKLGDDTATNFPYVITPVREVYNQAIQLLKEMSDPAREIKGGMLLLGESSAGKTRLALETLKQILPEWTLLRWQPYYTVDQIPSFQTLGDKPLILLLDDLHEYVAWQSPSHPSMLTRENSYAGIIPSWESPRVAALRNLIDTMFQRASTVVVVATCRSEHLTKVSAELGDYLLIKLRKLYLPSFSLDISDPQIKSIITDFQEKGHIHLEDWDGTIGSLILGLSRKHDQYLGLPTHVQVVLKTTKLLAYALIFSYSEECIRKACIGIFPQAYPLQNDELWQNTIDALLQMQFLQEDIDTINRNTHLLIRNDSYLIKVVSDYPPAHRQYQLEQDLSKLSEVFSELGDASSLSSLALGFSMQGLHNKAVEAFNRSHALYDSDTVSWTNMGVALVQLGRLEEALQSYDRAVALEPQNIPAKTNRGYCLELLKRYDEALACFEELLSVYPDDAYFWERKGFCLAKLGQHLAALEALDLVISLSEQSSDAWYTKSVNLPATAWMLKSLCLSELEQHDNALKAIDLSLSLNASNGGAWYLRGLHLSQLERHEEALAAFNQAEALDPKSIIIGYHKGVNLKRLGRNEEALKVFTSTVSLPTDDVGLLCEKAFCFEELKLYDEAIKIYEQYLVKNSKETLVWSHLGIDLVYLGRPIDALEAFEKALALNSSNAELWRQKGKCLLDELNKYEEALEAYEKACALDAGNTSALVGKAICLAQSGRIKEALQMYDQILVIEPTNIYAENNKGNCLLELGQYEEALSSFEHALARDPQNASLWGSMANCLCYLRRFQEASHAFQESLLISTEASKR